MSTCSSSRSIETPKTRTNEPFSPSGLYVQSPLLTPAAS
jgi:hypothetical protein